MNAILRALRALYRNCNGNTIVIFALSAPVLLLAGGMAIDYSHAASDRSHMQSALDAGVIAGLKAAQTETQTAAIAAATDFFNGNLAWTGASATFTFNSNGSLSGVANWSMPTMFGSFTGASTMALQVNSEATVASSGGKSDAVCVLLLSTSASPGLLANSGTNISAPTCEIDTASTGNPAATFNAGGTINAETICIAGSQTINNGGTYTNKSLSCAPPANPFVGKLPAPPSTTCSGSIANGGNYNGGSVTLSPGVYCGWFNFNSSPSVTLQPGVYVIKSGGWNVDGGTWVGSGVTFYFADSSVIQFNSGMNLTLSAPATGTYAGILVYEPDGLSNSNFVFDDSVGENLSGLIYLPSRNLTFNSTSNETTPNVTVVANTAIFDSVNWSLTPNSTWAISRSTSSGGASQISLVQ